MAFQFSPLKKIQNRYDEVVNEEKKKHDATLDFNKLPLLRRQQINFTQIHLKNLASQEVNGPEAVSKIATALSRLQKSIIGTKEYKDNKENKDNSWWDMVNIFKGNADNSLMYKNSDYVIGAGPENILDVVTERECFIALKDYLNNDLNRQEKIDPECLSKAKALSFIYEKISVLKEAELKNAIKKLKHVSDGVKLYAVDPIDKMKQANLIEAERIIHFNDGRVASHLANPDKNKKSDSSAQYNKAFIHLNHINPPKPMPMGERIKQERKQLAEEVTRFDMSSLKKVETQEKHAPLRFKFFKDEKAYLNPQELADYNKKMETTGTRPHTPAVRRK